MHLRLLLTRAAFAAAASMAAALLLFPASTAHAMAPPPGTAAPTPLAADDVVPGEVLLQLAPESFGSAAYRADLGASGRTGLADLDRRLSGLGARAITPVFDLAADPEAKRAQGMDRIFCVRFGADLGPAEAARRLAGSPDLLFAEPNRIAHAALTPNDPTYPSQWAHNNTGQAIRYGGGTVGTIDCDTDTDQAWDLQTGLSSVILAIVDTGVDTGHPEFSGRVVAGYDFVNGDTNPTDDNGHGTCCAGIALGAGNNSQGIAGVAWGVKLMPVKVLDSSGSGTYTMVANGITWAADNGARILSLSLGGGASSTLQTAVNYAVNTKGCAMFCASGNANASSLDYPAAYSNTIAVGALSPCNERKNPSSCDGETWWGSNYGSGLDFLAPGVRIHTTDIRGSGGFGTGDYITDFNGTSSATPHAAGIGALVWSQNTALTNTGLRSVLQANCDDLGSTGYDTQTGYGRLNAYRAVQNAGGGGTPTPVTLFSEGYETNTVPGSVWSAGDSNSTSGLDYWGDQSSGSGARVHGGSWSAYCADNSTVSGQRYDNNMRAHMTLLSPINVSGYTSVTFSFWKWHRTYNSSDYLSFQYWNGSAWVEQQRWSGSSSVWQQLTYTLSGFTTYKFRFLFVSNGSYTAEGAYIDDILLTGVPPAAAPPGETPETWAAGAAPAGAAPTLTLVSEISEGTVAASADRPNDAGEGAETALADALPGGRLLLAAPNPLRGEASLRFALETASDVRLEVFSAAGRRVATLAEGTFGAGVHPVTWKASGADGRAVAPGVYFARLLVNGETRATERLVIVK